MRSAIQSSIVAYAKFCVHRGFVFLLGGGSVLGTQPAVPGSGVLLRMETVASLQSPSTKTMMVPTPHFSGLQYFAATYSIDTINAGSGRGTFTFTDSGGGTYSYIFYLISSSQAVFKISAMASSPTARCRLNLAHLSPTLVLLATTPLIGVACNLVHRTPYLLRKILSANML